MTAVRSRVFRVAFGKVQRDRSRRAVSLVMDGQFGGDLLENGIGPHDELNTTLVGDQFSWSK